MERGEGRKERQRIGTSPVQTACMCELQGRTQTVSAAHYYFRPRCQEPSLPTQTQRSCQQSFFGLVYLTGDLARCSAEKKTSVWREPSNAKSVQSTNATPTIPVRHLRSFPYHLILSSLTARPLIPMHLLPWPTSPSISN